MPVRVPIHTAHTQNPADSEINISPYHHVGGGGGGFNYVWKENETDRSIDSNK